MQLTRREKSRVSPSHPIPDWWGAATLPRSGVLHSLSVQPARHQTRTRSVFGEQTSGFKGKYSGWTAIVCEDCPSCVHTYIDVLSVCVHVSLLCLPCSYFVPGLPRILTADAPDGAAAALSSFSLSPLTRPLKTTMLRCSNGHATCNTVKLLLPSLACLSALLPSPSPPRQTSRIGLLLVGSVPSERCTETAVQHTLHTLQKTRSCFSLSSLLSDCWLAALFFSLPFSARAED